jgi:hypothetical protein
MSFWDPKYLEEQKLRRDEEERRRQIERDEAKARKRRRDAQARSADLASKKKKQAALEEEEARRLGEGGAAHDSDEGSKDEWTPPVLNRGLGSQGFGIQRLASNKEAQEQIKRNELEMQRKALEEKATASAEQELVPKLNRPF